MDITEIRIKLCSNSKERLLGFCSITIDSAFVVRDLKIIGLLRVMFDPRSTLAQQVSAQLESHFGDKVFRAIIPRNVRLAEAPSHGLPGVLFDKTAKGSMAYQAFASEMIVRVKTL